MNMGAKTSLRARALGVGLAVLGLTSSLSAACRQSAAHPLAAPVTLPFELVSNLVFLQVSVEGSKPLWFVLDTGDAYALIDLEVAEGLGLELGGGIDVKGAGSGSLPGRMVQGGSFGLVGLAGFAQPLFLALPLGTLAHAIGHEFAGILGTDFFAAFVVEIDYARSVLTLHDRASYQAPAGFTGLPLTFDSQRHPTVRAALRLPGREPLEGVFVLDTGANDVLTLHAPFVAREGLLAAAGATIPRVAGLGAGGITEGVVGRLEELTLGPLRVQHPVASFSSASGGAYASDEAAGTIGGGLLSRFRVVLDYGRERVWLEPAAALAEPFEYDMSGLRVLTEGADFRTFRVVEVTTDSAAAQAGVRSGDVLAAVDGRAAAELTLSELRVRFRREGPCALSVVRGAERLELTLALRRRI